MIISVMELASFHLLNLIQSVKAPFLSSQPLLLVPFSLEDSCGECGSGWGRDSTFYLKKKNPPVNHFRDEGFHQLLIGTWDNSLSLDIIKSWASNIDKNGWVAREQILGDEARSRVPAEFQIQYPHFANPPTLVLSLKAYLNRLQDTRLHSSKEGVHVQGMGDEETIVSGSDPVLVRDRHLTDETTAVDYLKDIYPAFKRQFEWFKNTQWGDVKSGNRKTRGKVAFRWRGRTPDHTLTSGELSVSV